MTRIRNATEKDFYESLKIAKSLDKWFNNLSLKSMSVDFKLNHLAVAIDKKKVAGFLCYSSWEGSMNINWIGVKKEYQKKGIGNSLIDWLGEKAKEYGMKYLRVETLSNMHSNKYYEKTRQFYYKKGFKKIYDFKSVNKGWNNTILLEKKI